MRGICRTAAASIAIASWLIAASAQEYSFRTFLASDGLGNLSVQKIYQDREGFLWVSTENGIFRYDGQRFQDIGPAQGIPRGAGVAFGEAPDASLLVGSSGGIYRFNGSLFKKLSTPFETVSWTQGIQSDRRGHTYLGTEAGLFAMARQPSEAAFEFRRLYPASGAPPEPVYGVLVDGDAVWFGCGGKLCRLDAGKITALGEESGLPNVPFVAILKDGDGNLWVRARSEGILERPAGQSRFRRPDLPVDARVITGTPSLDHQGRILLGTPDSLLIGDKRGWQVIDRHVGMQGGVYAVLEDRQHSLWIGTGGRGLTQWRGYGEWEGYTSANGLPSDNVYEILPQPDASVLVGTEGGMILGHPRSFGFDWKTVPATKGVPVHSLQRDASGDLWIGTSSRAVGRIDRRTGQVQWFGADQGLTAKWAFTLRFDRGQNLWVATEAGLFSSRAPYRHFSRITELPASWFWTVAQGADGTVWAGGADGLFALAPSHQWRRLEHKDGLSNENVTAIGPDRDGSVWVGYQHGGGIDRVHLDPRGATIEHGLQRTGSDGLVYFLGFDQAGSLWAGTEHGVDVWDRTRWRHYDSTDGLIWDDCDLGAFAASDGSVWIGTGGGLSHFTPRPASFEPTPEVVFTELRKGASSVLGEKDPSFPAVSGALLASFAAPNARQDSSLLFRYRLDQGAASWTETTQRRLEFASLAPGSYALEIQVRDDRGSWSPKSAAFAFSIRPPWYLRTWFLLVVGLLPFVAVMLLFRVRSRAAQKRELHLRQIVEEKTRDLVGANEELRRLTIQDALTGLANRRRFDETIAQECSRLRRAGTAFSLLLIDVDHFKALNDSAGHQRGDEYLVKLGHQLAAAARRQIDVAARIGGEEFALVLPATLAHEAAQLAESVRLQIEELALPHPASPLGYLTVSIGVATATQERYCSPEELVGAADAALYQAKGLGRNRIHIAGE